MPGFERKRIVDKTDEELEEFVCGICFDIFINPMVTLCCRQIYCKECISEWLSENSRCPNDRKVLLKEELVCAPRAITNLLAKMRVNCDFQLKGCQTVVKFFELESHIKYCSFRDTDNCPKCGLESHESEACLQNLIEINKNLIQDNMRLKEENFEMKRFFRERNVLCGRQVMQSTIESAKLHINDYILEHREDRIDKELANTFVEYCKQSLLINLSYCDISSYIYSAINNIEIKPRKKWQVFVFALEGGESMTSGTEYFRVRFDSVIIEIFSTFY